MPWHFWEYQSMLTGVPKKSLCQKNMKFAVTPLVLTPVVPFRAAQARGLRPGPLETALVCSTVRIPDFRSSYASKSTWRPHTKQARPQIFRGGVLLGSVLPPSPEAPEKQRIRRSDPRVFFPKGTSEGTIPWLLQTSAFGRLIPISDSRFGLQVQLGVGREPCLSLSLSIYIYIHIVIIIVIVIVIYIYIARSAWVRMQTCAHTRACATHACYLCTHARRRA